ncbi:SRPBCC family protein [Marinobacter caseinilyticus]|uniref:SRPBCC family protein n=1 Tax=Marinobacter caseinilyticus TaxID=2692195 RepID=UPI00140C9DD3|nr:SRPBCC family protein [Marinobacter caseinilyticus]
MFCIQVERTLAKDIEAVFEAIADHASYQQFPGVDTSVLVEAGEAERNGTGALRVIGVGPLELTERITRFERPVVMHFLIEKSSPLPMLHTRGEIVLRPEGEGTHVTWISEGRITIPLLGRVLDKLAEKQFSRAFASLLKAIERL